MRGMVVAAALCASGALAQERVDGRVAAIAGRVDPSRMQATVAKLVSFGTRHTLSDTQSETRGIGAARRWLVSQFDALAKSPGSRLKTFEDRFTAQPGRRIPAPVEIWNVGVVLPGTDAGRAKEAVVMTGHYDSIPSDVMDPKTDAPGADDDGSGTSMILELARAFAQEQPAVAIYFVAVAGEEQGLVGSQHLAERLKAEGVEVLAMTSVDIVGSSEGQNGVRDSATVRVFSEGVPAVESEQQKRLREAVGGENDGPAREWARYVARQGELYVPDLQVRVMLRRDRIARGSDHMSFARVGYPAAVLRESKEDYHREHQTPRSENGVEYGDVLSHFDPRYAARVCRVLGSATATLAFAPLSPQGVTLAGAVSPDTALRWTLPKDPRIAGVVLYQRPADSVRWQRATSLGKVDHVTLPGVIPDDFFFAVATTDAQGNESLPQPPQEMGR
jgi:hypothetical protein